MVFSQQRFFQLDEKPQINQDNDLLSMRKTNTTLLNNNLSYFVYPHDLILISISQYETFQLLKVLQSWKTQTFKTLKFCNCKIL